MDEQCQPFISVIIPVFNDAERLKLCLTALEQQTYPSDRYEVIVVDNGSTEDIKSVVEQFSRATFAFESRTGSYAARNQGISIAQGNVIAFTDADCVPAQNWLEIGASHLLKTPNCGLVAGRIELFFKDPDRPTTVEMYESVTAFQQKKFVEELRYGATANVFTYKHVIEKAGLFNDGLKSNGDREWGQRVYAAGFAQVYVDDLWVSHPARYTWGDLYKRIVRITGGHHDFKRQKGYTWKGFLRDLSRDLLPPLDNYSCIWSAQRLNPLQKMQMTMVMLSTKYLSAWERVRLQFGGISTRG